MWIIKYVFLWFWMITPTYGGQVDILDRVAQAKDEQRSICVPKFTDNLKMFFDPESAKYGSEKLRICASEYLFDEAYLHLDHAYGSEMFDNLYREIQAASENVISAKPLSENRYSDSISKEGASITQVLEDKGFRVDALQGYQTVGAQ